MFKKLLSLFISMTIIIGMLPISSITAFAYDDGLIYGAAVPNDDFTYTFYEGDEARELFIGSQALTRKLAASSEGDSIDVLGIKAKEFTGVSTLDNLVEIGELSLNKALNGVFEFQVNTKIQIDKNDNLLKILSMVASYFPHYFSMSYSCMPYTDATAYRVYTLKLLNLFDTSGSSSNQGCYKWEVAFAKDYVAQNPYNSANESAYDYTKEIHDYLCDTITYATKGGHGACNQHAFCALSEKKSVCAGYARSFSLICLYAGLDAPMWTGDANNSQKVEAHGWNMIYSDEVTEHNGTDGEPLMIDCTWDDNVTSISYNYFWKHFPESGTDKAYGRNISDGLVEFMAYIHDTEYVPPVNNTTYDITADTIKGLTSSEKYSVNGANFIVTTDAIASNGLNLTSILDKATKNTTVEVRNIQTNELIVKYIIEPRQAAPEKTLVVFDSEGKIDINSDAHVYRFNNDAAGEWQASAKGKSVSIKTGASNVVIKTKAKLANGVYTPCSKSTTVTLPKVLATPRVSIDYNGNKFTGATAAMEYQIVENGAEIGKTWKSVVLVNKIFPVTKEMSGKDVYFRLKYTSKTTNDIETITAFASGTVKISVPTIETTVESSKVLLVTDNSGHECIAVPGGTEYSLDNGVTFKLVKEDKKDTMALIKINKNIDTINSLETVPDTYKIYYRDPSVVDKLDANNNKLATTASAVPLNLIRIDAPASDEVSFNSGVLVVDKTKNSKSKPSDYQVSINKGSSWVNGSNFNLKISAKETSVYVRYAPTSDAIASKYTEVKIPASSAISAKDFKFDYSDNKITLCYSGSDSIELSNDGISFYKITFLNSKYLLCGSNECDFLTGFNGINTIYLRNSSTTTNSISSTIKLSTKASAKAPSGVKLSLSDYSLTGLKDTLEYSINKSGSDENKWISVANGQKTAEITTDEESKYLLYARIKATENAPASAAAYIGEFNSVKRAAPSNVCFSEDKKLIIHLNTLMEYSTDGSTWISAVDKTLDASSISKIYIRYKKVPLVNLPVSKIRTLTKS